ncbi:hypothetical protein EK21DRAFT_81580 [Setomelanomma holmii]|uniref:Translation elongation factor EF1B beta/delta subunit guanine nucleotide exchange domain-containing protein n=1 Tax=Setomelanomma holmii TaxID=210430 RepID=A0A9P4LFG2_9PLEO|nr:hypothetical protein EK21DRAFT_81580 [Setomelanomma holmii]
MSPKPTPKTIVTLDIKPWAADTDMAALRAAVVAIQQDGLVWGSSTLVDIGYGIKKLQQTLVIEDQVSLDDIQTEVEDLEDFVQSTDIVQMSKL